MRSIGVLFVFLSLVCVTSQLLNENKFGSFGEVHDKEHMKQHLGNKIDVEQMNEQKQRFHYFKLHDLNKDGALDGIEIIKALTHSHEEHDSKPRDPMQDSELENLVDAVLKDMDLNNDGRINFAEYLRKQQVN
ncbi:hypothetical protein M3Y97_00134300 [Aphelenchoides bicaudatus]|nr:hypothetical protein M3Y97_00134300 [Aphelenchoides bicaudatus]